MEKMESDRAMTINARCRLGLLQATQDVTVHHSMAKSAPWGRKEREEEKEEEKERKTKTALQ